MKKIVLAMTVLVAVLFGGNFEDGVAAYNSKNYKKAAEFFQKAAEQGNASAQYNLGVMYDNGQGVKKDYKKAIELYKKAAEQGNASAQSNLGVMYYYGRGVKKDKIKAYQLMMKAAKQGNVLAQSNLDIICRQSPWVCK